MRKRSRRRGMKCRSRRRGFTVYEQEGRPEEKEQEER